MSISGIRRRFRSWARRHSYSLFSSLGALLKHRIGTLMTVLVLGIAMLLPLGLFVTLENLDRMDLEQDEWGAISVFATPGTDAAGADRLVAEIEALPAVSGVERVSPEQGMEEFRDTSGFGPSLDLLESNPLPWVLMVNPDISQDSAISLDDRLTELMAGLEQLTGVASVHYDYKWLQRLGRMLELGQAFVLVLGLLFGLTVIVVIANTIRLDVAARSEEIEILALVGAGNSFIRQPFLYSGIWYGVMGGLLAYVLLEICLRYLSLPLGRLLDAYGYGIALHGLTGPGLGLLLLASGLLGFFGAWISVQRYLRMLVVGGSLGRR